MISYRLLLPAIFLALTTAAPEKVNAQGMRPGKAFADSIAAIGATSGGHAGIDLMDIEANKGYTIHGHDHFPMLSVFKFPITLYFLDQVDRGKISLDEKFTIKKEDWAKTFSPLLNAHKETTIQITLRDLLIAVIQISDNVACDVLLARAGGPSFVNAYIHSLNMPEINSLNIPGINITVTETQMASDPKTMYDNWCTPAAMNTLLEFFYQGHILSAVNTALLLEWMTGVTTGPHRLKGLLPANTIVAHKTGTSNTSPDGLTIATNDVGIITLHNGHHLCITVFIMDSRADKATREGAIARIARLAYDTMSAAK
jgi:beta-lactamase class A